MKDPKKQKNKNQETDIDKQDAALLEKIQYIRENSPEQNGEDF